jgi:hypothetical protein
VVSEKHAVSTTGLEIAGKATEMACKSCRSENLRNLYGELAIHFPGVKGLTKPIIWVFPKLMVCLDCGATELTIPEPELQRLVKEDAV